MGSNKKIVRNLEDVKINVKLKLAALWASVMFIYIYADIQTFFQTGIIEQLITGEVIGIKITQTFLLGSAVLMSIPSIMIFLSLTLKPKVNRLINIIISILHIGLIIALQFMPAKVYYYYKYFQLIEILFHLLIVWYAWKWPQQED